LTAAISDYSEEPSALNALIHPTHYYSLPVEATAAVVVTAPVPTLALDVVLAPTVEAVVVDPTAAAVAAAPIAVVVALTAASTRFVEGPVGVEM
jgi:hypothetical protein